MYCRHNNYLSRFLVNVKYTRQSYILCLFVLACGSIGDWCVFILSMFLLFRLLSLMNNYYVVLFVFQNFEQIVTFLTHEVVVVMFFYLSFRDFGQKIQISYLRLCILNPCVFKIFLQLKLIDAGQTFFCIFRTLISQYC